jgi:hypothetical protein
MRQKGSNFQFCSSEKDFVSDSFATLRGESNAIVGAIVDSVMPTSHNCSTRFKLLGHHGEHQENRASGNKAGGAGEGHRIDLGARDHDRDAENMNGIGPTPRTNGGVKCFDELTGTKEIDVSREDLQNCFGSLLEAIQLTVDKVRDQRGLKRIFDDFTRDESSAAQLREVLKPQLSSQLRLVDCAGLSPISTQQRPVGGQWKMSPSTLGSNLDHRRRNGACQLVAQGSL